MTTGNPTYYWESFVSSIPDLCLQSPTPLLLCHYLDFKPLGAETFHVIPCKDSHPWMCKKQWPAA